MVQAFEALVRIFSGKLLHLECSKVVYFSLNPKASCKGNGYWCEPQSLKAQEAEALMFKGSRIWTTQLKKGENSYFLCLFVLFGPPKDWVMLTLSSKSIESYANLFQKHPITSRNDVLPVKLTHKITIMGG